MAKENRAADLDAELAALEAEIAALEGKKPRKGRKATPPAAPESPAAPQPPAAARAEMPAKGRFSLPIKAPSFGRKKDAAPGDSAPAAPEAAPAPIEAPAPAATPAWTAPPPASELTQRYDPTLWRHEGDAWVRVVPQTPVPVVRRVLDENDALVREEPATRADLDSVAGVRAERGLGKLFRRKSS